MKKIISFVAAVLLLSVLLSLFGCGGAGTLIKIDPTAEEARVIGTIGNYDILYDELRYITLTYKDQLKNKYGENIFDSEESAAPYKDELASLVYSSITANYGVLALAQKNGISTDDSWVRDYCNLKLEEIASQITLMIVNKNTTDDDDSKYTPTNREVNAEYAAQIKEAYLTDRYIRFVYSVDGCVEMLVKKYIKDGKVLNNDNDIEKYIKDNFCRTLHVYVRNDDGESVAENRAKAEIVLDELKGGKSFNSMVGSKYNDDLMTTTVNGHYFAEGEMEEVYEKAAFALEVGEYSDIIETAGGFYIIKRLPLEDDYINHYFENLKSQYQYAAVNKDINAERGALSLVLNDFGKTLELWSIK